jgi:hypothetical protein
VCSNLKQVLPLQDNNRIKFFSPALLPDDSAQVFSNLQQVLPLQDNHRTKFFSPALLRDASAQVLPLQDNLGTKFSHLSWLTTLPLQCAPTRGGSKDLQSQEKMVFKISNQSRTVRLDPE